MATAQPSFPHPRYLAGIGVSLAAHALLVVLWQLSHSKPVQEGESPRMLVLRLLPAPVPDRPEPPPPAPERPAATGARAAPAARPPLPAQDPLPAAPVTETIAVPAAETAPAASLSASDLLREARAAAGAADRAQRKEHPQRGIQAPIETAAMKLERGITQAAEMAPNKWYQAPKVQEIIDPGGYGRRRHRVITANGTYCVTYESNHAPDGIDSMKEGIKPKLTNCDADEQPATKQKWN